VLFKKFIPHLRVDSIYDIDLDALWKSGVRGIITDLDNTLVGADAPDATPELLEWLKKVESLGFKTVVVSNNNRLRVSAFAEPIKLPYIWRAKKPSTQAFRKAIKLLQLSPMEVVVLGDQLLTDVLGANRLGVKAILVAPIAPQDEKVFTRFNRRVERYIFRVLKKRGLLIWDK
jgi:uncharacterized protein